MRILLEHVVTALLFGWLVWRKGFESAVLAHGVTYVLLYGVLPVVMKSLHA